MIGEDSGFTFDDDFGESEEMKEGGSEEDEGKDEGAAAKQDSH